MSELYAHCPFVIIPVIKYLLNLFISEVIGEWLVRKSRSMTFPAKRRSKKLKHQPDPEFSFLEKTTKATLGSRQKKRLKKRLLNDKESVKKLAKVIWISLKYFVGI